MHFSDHLKNQIELHPSIQPQDIVKLCYQAAFGAEHLLLDIKQARTYFETELLPILQAAAKLPKNDVKIIAIDGRAASGKTTLAGLLQRILSADVIHMDDFFLPPVLRTEERLSEPGGNIHYERFIEEVLPFLRKDDSFSYRIFDCSRMNYNGSQAISSAPFRIVEGAYSCHPLFGDYADLKVFSDISPEEQMQRIQKRNGAEMAEIFQSRWIPMEETYYSHFRIKEKADIIL